MREKDIESLQHTTWRCQYHVVFAPKYRRMVIYGQIKVRTPGFAGGPDSTSKFWFVTPLKALKL